MVDSGQWHGWHTMRQRNMMGQAVSARAGCQTVSGMLGCRLWVRKHRWGPESVRAMNMFDWHLVGV